MLELYTNIRKRREELGLTQSQLADLAGYADKTMISKIEKGSIDLAQSKIVTIASALQTTPGKLMGWSDSSVDQEPASAYDNDLLSDEQSLLDRYRTLNRSGKDKVLEYIDDLAENDKYRKFTESSSDTKGGVAG